MRRVDNGLATIAHTILLSFLIACTGIKLCGSDAAADDDDLCNAVPVGEGLEYGACCLDIVDQSGAINFDVVTNPRTGLIKPARGPTPASVFEKFASKVWVPPSRPDLKKKRQMEIAREVKGNK